MNQDIDEPVRGECVPARNQIFDKECLNHQLIKGTLARQCFMHLTREDHQALSKQFCSVLIFPSLLK